MTPYKRYLVKYKVNDEIFEEEMCTIEIVPRKIIADFNTELDDRFYGENRDIISYKRITTPNEMKIPGLETYYEKEKTLL